MTLIPFGPYRLPSCDSFAKEVEEGGIKYTKIIYSDGCSWYVNGKLHRENGPAVIDMWNKTQKYYLNGEEVSKEDFPKKLKLSAFW